MRLRTIVTAVTLGLVAALALTGCGTTVVPSSESAMFDTVTAQGTGTALAPPDTAQLTFGSSASAPDADTALATVSETAEAISAAVRAAGVADADVQTANVSVYPEYAHEEGKSPQVTGYRASLSVRVKVRDLSTVGEVISAANDAGATEINGPVFTLDDKTQARAEALTNAVDDARARAEAMAEASEKTLGEVKVVSETALSVPPMWPELSRYSLQADAAYVPIETGQLDITAQVTVVFELE